MIRPPPRSTLPDPLFPYPPRCRADAIARPEGKAQFLNTIADRFAVAGIPGCQSLETVSDPNPRPAILQSVHPFGERDALADFDILSFIRSEEHTSELQSLMRISYAVFCLKKKVHTTCHHTHV